MDKAVVDKLKRMIDRHADDELRMAARLGVRRLLRPVTTNMDLGLVLSRMRLVANGLLAGLGEEICNECNRFVRESELTEGNICGECRDSIAEEQEDA